MRYFTVDEANAALERVHAIVERVRELTASARGRVDRISGNGSSNGRTPGSGTGTQVGALLEELGRDGIVLRDVDRGLVDFPAVAPSGREYWLCWIVDEPAVEWWHWPEDGFAGRTPLSQPPE
ncbi:MAG: DUF2203 domain-containing protein [Actinobacteria bacterium]|nr:DUF2203 domain-containing protein [Actinomycetota bacterium]